MQLFPHIERHTFQGFLTKWVFVHFKFFREFQHKVSKLNNAYVSWNEVLKLAIDNLSLAVLDSGVLLRYVLNACVGAYFLIMPAH